MPYSTHVPPIIFPDSHEAKLEFRKHLRAGFGFSRNEVAFCKDWKSDGGYPPKCLNANQMGDRNHNWCFRCPAGYMLLTMHEKDFATSRGRPLNLTGW